MEQGVDDRPRRMPTIWSVTLGLTLIALAVQEVIQRIQFVDQFPDHHGAPWFFVTPALIFLVGVTQLWSRRHRLWTWSPFQSPAVREILAHLSESEGRAARRRALGYGFWCFATFAGPLVAMSSTTNPLAVVFALMLVTLHLCCIPPWLRAQRRFLASTAWAAARGIEPEQLRLSAFAGRARTDRSVPRMNDDGA